MKSIDHHHFSTRTLVDGFVGIIFLFLTSSDKSLMMISTIVKTHKFTPIVSTDSGVGRSIFTAQV